MSAGAALAHSAELPDLIRLRDRAAPLTGMLRLEVEPADREGWIACDALADPAAAPFAELQARFTAAGFACNRRAAAASLLLRYGWAAGFQIATWLQSGFVLHLERFSLKFSPSTLVEAIWVHEARIEAAPPGDAGRAALLASLVSFTAPLVASQHRWSRFSRHALWSMATSSWAAQFAAIGERLGRRDEAVEEGLALLAADPEIAGTAPDVYTVTSGGRSRVCQRRSACCLYYKGPAKHFCASCPIIPHAERIERNRTWVAAGA